MAGMEENPLDLLPEVLLAASAVGGLLLGCWLPRARQWPVAALGYGAAAAGIVAAALQPPGPAFGGAFVVDDVTSASRIIVLGGLLVVLALGVRPLAGHPRQSEYAVLLQLASLGALLLAGSADLLLLAAAYLLASVPSYVLAGFGKDAAGTEAAMKYYVVGALLGIVMLGGITLLYAAARGVGYPALRAELPGGPLALATVGVVAVTAGLLFKAGGVPGHFWVPDAVQGSAAPVAAFLTTVPKVAALAALYRLGAEAVAGAEVPWAALVAVVSAASMTLGNLAAFFQQDVRRLLAYSTISQVGYLLLPVAVVGRTGLAQPALLFYLAAYALTNLGAFAVVCAVPGRRTIDAYRGLGRRSPALVGALAVCLLGLVGTPPTAVFLGKVTAFSAAVDGGFAWLAVVAAANTVASLFYYLRWIAPTVATFRGPGPAGAAGAAGLVRPAAVTAYAAAAGSVALGLVGGPVLALLEGS
ncbi:NADH-quinone oxidoreductase subunit N [Streptomyces sp. NPDC048057]|uniref:NADH-quinone oxidoreductase subunit N n=1 Tax=Streptomyces sp. NPDC048057 TaxID=3155628 RepID=UPI0033E1B612